MPYAALSSRKRIAARSLSVFVLFLGALLHAQSSSAKLQGTITDSQGNGLVKAVVTAKNNATETVKTTRSDANGNFTIDDLPAGSYTVEASSDGFASLSKSDITLNAGQTQVVALSLKISSVLQEITVNAGVDSLAAQTAPSGGFIEERSAQSLISNTYI